MIGPTLQTERLILRPPIQDDLDAWAANLADAEAARFIGGVQPRSVAWRTMATIAGSWALNGFGMFSVLERPTGRWIGRIGPNRPEGWPGTEIGWGLAREAWGQGLALEATRATMDWAFDHLGWTEVIHCIRSENAPSIALALRLGSTHQGVAQLPAPHGPPPIDIYGQTAAQWRERRSAL